MENHPDQPNEGAEEQPISAQPEAENEAMSAQPDMEPTEPTAEGVPAEEEATEPEVMPVDKHKRIVLALAILLALAALSLCAIGGFTLGSGLLGSREKPTPTQAPTPTPIPTPEPGQPPRAIIDAATRGVVGEEMSFDGSYSAGATALVRFEWDFGDGSGAQGAAVTHVYDQPGAYVVTLIVTDEQGLSDSTSVQVRVEEQAEPPQAVIQGPQSAKVGEVVTFDGSASTAGRPLVSYVWDFGDLTQGAGAVVDHIYAEPGTYEVTLTVTDNAGQSAETSVEIIIEQAEQTPPTGVIQGPTQAIVGEKVTFDAGGSQPGDSPIVNYAWDLGNGETSSGPREITASTIYTKPGVYNVSLTVTDENGLSHATGISLTVNAGLEGVLWQLESSLEEAPITAEFDKGKLTGSTGCNEYSATYEVSGNATHGSIEFSDITATRRVCEEIIMAQETQYLMNLEQVTDFRVSGDELTLRYPGGALLFKLGSTSQ